MFDPHSRAPTERQLSILVAASTCFGRDGFAATSVQDICREAGASVGTLYHHFGNKEGVASALYVEALRRYQQGLLTVLESSAGARDGVRAVVHYHLRWVSENRALARHLLGRHDAEAPLRARDDIGVLNRAFGQRTENWINTMQNKGQLRPLGYPLHVALLIGPAQQVTREWLGHRDADLPEEIVAVLADAAWRSVGLAGDAE
jgi:AcrR family transcriptional regulator